MFRTKRLATALLPFWVLPVVLCVAQSVIHTRRSVFLHAGQHMTVEVERDADLGMPQSLAGDLRVNAGSEQMSGVGVTEIVEAEPLQFGLPDQFHPLMGDEGRLQWAGIGLGADERILR